MSADDLRNPMTESGVTMHSDSEQYSAELTSLHSSPSRDRDQPLVLYQPPTVWSLFRGATINLFLPFVNGLMMGFGELFAHEFAFRLGWSGTRVFPESRRAHAIGPGVEVRDRRSSSPDLFELTSME